MPSLARSRFHGIPMWSGDSSEVAFGLLGPGGVLVVSVAAMEERRIRQVVEFQDALEWATGPQSREVAWSRRKGEAEPSRPEESGCGPSGSIAGAGGELVVWRVEATGGTSMVDLGRGCHPAWDPTGKRLAFIERGTGDAQDAVAIADVTSQERRRLPLQAEVRPHVLRWSPSGDSIAFCAAVFPPTALISEHGAIRWELGLTASDLCEFRLLTWAGFVSKHGWAWLGEGEKIRFVSLPVPGRRPEGHGRSALWEVDVESGEGTLLRQVRTVPTHAAWRPDGEVVAAVDYALGRLELHLLPVGEGGEAILARDVVGVPSWSPDGSKIAFITIGGRLVVADPEGGRVVCTISDEPAFV